RYAQLNLLSDPVALGTYTLSLHDALPILLDGVQHKYRETVLFFPAQGQTCHSYCTFCFRWAQFVGDKDLKMSSTEAEKLHGYLQDRKSTRLNSSHVKISYAVFCLKKKKVS